MEKKNLINEEGTIDNTPNKVRWKMKETGMIKGSTDPKQRPIKCRYF